MQKLNVQMSLLDTYNDVCEAMENEKCEFIALLEDHIDLENYIPLKFYQAFYKRYGRSRKYSLESFLWFCILQKILGIYCDKTLLLILKISRELRGFCGFDDVPDSSKITRFRQVFKNYIEMIFDNLVEITEPICHEIDEKKAKYLIYDPTGIKVNVAENNPKFFNTKLNQAKKMCNKNSDLNPYLLVYGMLPEIAQANPFVKQQYINGHFCYAHKAGFLTNGNGIIRGISLLDEQFRIRHPEVVSKRTDNPELDKEVDDSKSLKPVLTDYFNKHPNFSYNTFLGDSAFDSYDNYKMLRKDFGFERMCIPMNKRNSADKHSDFDENGIPLCPLDKTPFNFAGVCKGENRSQRFKYICHKSEAIPKTSKRICTCETPCTDSKYGRCVYTYPDNNLRLYHGIARGTEHWDNLYRHRVNIERTINIFKDTLGVSARKSYDQRIVKADLLFAGITQLIGVLLAHAINKPKLYKSIRKLIA